MDAKQTLLRNIPKMDELLLCPQLIEAAQKSGQSPVTEAARMVLEQSRADILNGSTPKLAIEALTGRILDYLADVQRPSLRPVLNATGVLLHTNLGRAVMSEEAARAAMEVACSYSTLEYNCEQGRRGSRYDHVKELLVRLTGAEDALVVNNNAAAVLLILSTVAKNKEVVVSRGELVEIGGSFRVPEIMEQSGSVLREVGTTNKTHSADYERAVCEQTGALLKVHTSNYKIMGFTESVSLFELAELGKSFGVPVIYDLGSGALLPLTAYGLSGEPTVQEAVKSGADVISFSGDKLLGGPQAGIILGSQTYISAMKKNPLTRAIRIDKMTLAALEATLRLYLDPQTAASKIPLYRMLSLTTEELKLRADLLAGKIEALGFCCQVLEEEGQVGGGSVPTQVITTAAVAVSGRLSETEMERRLREFDPPIIARVAKGRILLDLRTLPEDSLDVIVRCFDGMKAASERGCNE